MSFSAVNDVPKRRLLLLSGNAHPALASEVAEHLGTKLCDVKVGKFKNGETAVQINESVRDCDAFVLQPTCNPSVNDYLMELLLMCDALRRAGAWRVTAVVPFYAYARQDKSDGTRAPIAAKYVTDAIGLAGAARIVTVDLHAPQIQGMTSQPFENIYGLPLIAEHIVQKLGLAAGRGGGGGGGGGADVAIVSPDAGGAKRAEMLAKALDTDIAIFSKKRERANEVAAMVLVGDVKDKICILMDDMVDTAGTLCLAAEQLVAAGARRVLAACTHGVLSEPALERLSASPIEKLLVLDTIPVSDKAARCPKLEVISSAPLLARAIHTLHYGGSNISDLYHYDAANPAAARL